MTAGLSAILLVCLSILVVINSDSPNGISMDGNFSDWESIPQYYDESDQENRNIDIQTVAVERDSIYLSYYLKTRIDMFTGIGKEGNTVRFFLDGDLLTETGYQIHGIGADYLIEIYGHDNRVLSANYYEFDVNYRTETVRGQNDWNGWSPMFGVDCALNGNRLEAQLWIDELNIPPSVAPRSLVQTLSPRGTRIFPLCFLKPVHWLPILKKL